LGNTRQGRVKWYNADEQFGFITAVGGDEIFVHASQMPNPPPRARDRVSFTVVTDHRGRQQATAVQKE
jgi:CspA family cold shock protein